MSCSVFLCSKSASTAPNGSPWRSPPLAVLYLAVLAGRPPWIALTLAVSFSLYGLLRKVISVDALPGLATETLLLLPLALAYLAWCQATGSGALTNSGPGIAALLIGSGLVTAIPLFLFAYGARALPYSTLGVLQYIAPSLQLVCGVYLFHESFGTTARRRLRRHLAGTADLRRRRTVALAPRLARGGNLNPRLAGYCLAREMYSPVRVSTRITSPSLMNNGTRTTAPVSSFAGF